MATENASGKDMLLAKKQAAAAARMKTILGLSNEGKTPTQIAAQLGIPMHLVSGDLAVLEMDGHPVTRGRAKNRRGKKRGRDNNPV